MFLNFFRLLVVSIISLFILSACQLFDHSAATSKITPEKIKKNSTGPVTLIGHCQKTEDDGYSDKIMLVVKKNEVKALQWTAHPHGGSCKFDLKNFKQVGVMPTTDLESKKDKKCHLYMWQDADHVTVAIYNCRKICRLNDKVLPVLLDPQTGGCKARETAAEASKK